MCNDTISEYETNEIRKELYDAIDTLIKGCETLDLELAFKIFSNDPGFLMMGTDGTICDYKTYLNNNINYLKDCTSFQLKTYNKEIRILNRNVAILSWAYNAEAILKTGERDVIEKAGASFVFSKVNAEWKVMYYHESSLPPTRI